MKTLLVATLFTGAVCAEPVHLMSTWLAPTTGGAATGYQYNFCKNFVGTPSCTWLPEGDIPDPAITQAYLNIDTIVDADANLGIRVRSYNGLGAFSDYAYAGPVAIPKVPGPVENLNIEVKSGVAP